MSYDRMVTKDGKGKAVISGGRDMNKPAVPEYIQAKGGMKRVHSGGTHKASSK